MKWKVDEPDDEDDQDAEDAEDGEEEDDSSNHATVVADPAETTNPRENEKPSRRTKRDEPGEDEGEGGGDDRDERKRKRKPTTCLPTANQRSNES